MSSPGDNPAQEEVTKASQSADEPREEQASFRLRVVDGFDTGREFVIHGTEASRQLVGKGPTADLKLLDPAVSRRHLAFEIERSRLRITDLGSTNGTRLDDHEIVDAFARGGEILRIGSTSIRVERVGQVPAVVEQQVASGFGRVIGASPAMRRVYRLCERLAASEVPVIIEGETGV